MIAIILASLSLRLLSIILISYKEIDALDYSSTLDTLQQGLNTPLKKLIIAIHLFRDAFTNGCV